MNRPTELFNEMLEAICFEVWRTTDLADELGSYDKLLKRYAEAEDYVNINDEHELKVFIDEMKAEYPTIEAFAEAMPLAILDSSTYTCKGIDDYNAAAIADVLDTWVVDYASQDLIEELENSGVRKFCAYPMLEELAEIGEALHDSDDENERKFYAEHDWDFDLVDMICSGCDDVDLDKVIYDRKAALEKVYSQQLDAIQKIIEMSDLANPSEDVENAVQVLLNLEKHYNEIYDGTVVSHECEKYEDVLDKLTREYNGSHLAELADSTWTVARENLAARGLFPEKFQKDEDYDVRELSRAAAEEHKTSDAAKQKKMAIERD